MSYKPLVCACNLKWKELGPLVKFWKCRQQTSYPLNFLHIPYWYSVRKKGSVLSLSLVNAKNCLAHRLKPGFCKNDSIAFLKPLQSKSFQFLEGMLNDFFPLLVQYLVLLPLLEILVITEIQQCLFNFVPICFQTWHLQAMGVRKTFVWLAFASSYFNKGGM